MVPGMCYHQCDHWEKLFYLTFKWNSSHQTAQLKTDSYCESVGPKGAKNIPSAHLDLMFGSLQIPWEQTD